MTLQEKDLNSVGIQVLNKGADLYHLRDQVYYQVLSQVRNQIENQVLFQVMDQVYYQVLSQVRNQTYKSSL